MTTETVNKKILSDAKNKSFKAFEAILSRYEKPIFNYIFRLVNHRQDAEDLTQETFIKVYTHLSSIDPEKSFQAWLYKIATNTVYDWSRKKGVHSELFIIDDPESGFETIDEDFSYINIETAKDVENALGALKPAYRAVLLLFYWQDLSYEEISSALSLPVNTVKTHLRRAKNALKEKLTGKSNLL